MENLNQKTELKYEAPFEERISRLFMFRFLWLYVEVWVVMVWGMWMGIINFLHFWYMLFLGKRHEGFWKKKLRFMRNISKWQAYIMTLTDKRPKFIED